jgi:hypothetical protein
MLRTREAREIRANLGHQRLGEGTPDTGDGIQSRDRVLVGAHALSDLGADPSDALVQEVDVGQLLGPPSGPVLITQAMTARLGTSPPPQRGEMTSIPFFLR